MIRNDEYMDYLQKIISCISNGDYYSVKELSILQLNNLKKDTKMMEQELKEYVKINKCKKEIKKLNDCRQTYLLNKYVDYLNNIIKDEKNFKEIASIEEFMQELIWIYEIDEEEFWYGIPSFCFKNESIT